MSQPSPDHRSGARETTESADAGAVDAGALDAVLRATLDAAELDERVTSEEVEALRAVAARHGDAPLSYDPIAIELVLAIMQVNYGHLKRSPDVWRSTAVKIATLLFDSPTGRARLENLWSRLVESHGR